jgi:hypothetical protein
MGEAIRNVEPSFENLLQEEVKPVEVKRFRNGIVEVSFTYVNVANSPISRVSRGTHVVTIENGYMTSIKHFTSRSYFEERKAICKKQIAMYGKGATTFVPEIVEAYEEELKAIERLLSAYEQ